MNLLVSHADFSAMIAFPLGGQSACPYFVQLAKINSIFRNVSKRYYTRITMERPDSAEPPSPGSAGRPL